MNDNRHWPDSEYWGSDPTCACDDCQRERDGDPEPNPIGFAFLMLTLLVLAGISFWRIFS